MSLSYRKGIALGWGWIHVALAGAAFGLAAGVVSCGGDDFQTVPATSPDASAGTGGVGGTGGSGGTGATGGSDAGGSSTGGSSTGGIGGTAGDAGGTGGDAGACDANHKKCGADCVALDDPATGCAGPSCDPCTLSHATATCDGQGACAIETCADGFADCDDDPSNGCEGNTDNDPGNCGTCGHTCPAAGGTPKCENATCGISNCDQGRGDCDSDPSNGCEVDLLTTTAHCGFCNNACDLSFASSSCQAGTCKVDACDGARGNCDGDDSNGCEEDLDTSAQHCGDCAFACPQPDHTTAACSDGQCQTSCNTGFGDCDADDSNGCETDVTTDWMHCGDCDTQCEAPHGKPGCGAAACTIDSCNTGWADCDGIAATGCEMELAISTANCGACGNICPVPANATATCAASTCGFTCLTGFADCDGDASNGCEIDLTKDVQHCGTCTTACTVPNGTPGCTAGACTVAQCNAGWGNCDGQVDNGCEVHLTQDVQHCGTCATACSVANGTPGCVAGACAIAQCDSGWANCDNQVATGCEVNTNTSTANCGACALVCAPPRAEPLCAAGACKIDSCDIGFGDCDGAVANGCEINTTNDRNHCGSCTTVCSFGHATPTCIGSTCTILSCDAGWGNCDSVLANGCETNTNTSLAHCGMCGAQCSFPNAAATCNGGVCIMGACAAGWANCDGNATNGCETYLASSSKHCGVCGHDCLGGGCSSAQCQPVTLASGQNEPWSIATDGVNVYWTNRTATGSVQRMSVAGGGVVTIAANEGSPDGLALNDKSVLWADFATGTIRSAPLTGGSATTLTTVATAGPAGIAATDTHVYWTNWALGTIQRLNLTSSAIDTLSASGNANPHRIATDGSFVYWTNFAGDNVRRVAAGGGTPTQIAGTQNGALGIAIDNANVYWSAEYANTITRAPLAGGSTADLATGQDKPVGVAVDYEHVYWVNSGASGTVCRVPKGGGTVETLAVLQPKPVYIALDNVSIYWTNNAAGTIMRLAK